MLSSATKKKICIHITTYKREELDQDNDMDEKANKKGYKAHNKFVCAICLNSKVDDKSKECCKKISKSCPICQKNCVNCANTHKMEKERVVADKEKAITDKDSNVKTVQTSETNVAQGLSLLNEVLTVFQNKKVDINKEKVKSGLLKDVAVSTDDKNDEKNAKDQSRLTVSTFQYSIDESKKPENGKFTIVNCCQPDFVKKSQYSIDLIKHKSSSIPQMKLEELKYSLKEKSRSKDAIEEVNRMFATVRKPGKHMENSNRPVVRNGPRVLPVVKNKVYQENKKDLSVEVNDKHSCKCCQTCMSSGDSFMKNDCGHDSEKERCDKCVYMLCCHYENKRKRQTGVLICEHCRSLNEEHYCQHENYVDDSC